VRGDCLQERNANLRDRCAAIKLQCKSGKRQSQSLSEEIMLFCIAFEA
jgi:hypothetical protein